MTLRLNQRHDHETATEETVDMARNKTYALSEERIFQEQRELERIIQPLLAWGVWVSAGLMLVGLLLNLRSGHGLPAAVPALNQILPQLLALQPDSFLAVGLVVLIATPILRVVISAVAFLLESDRRYARITGIVLLIVIASIVFAQG